MTKPLAAIAPFLLGRSWPQFERDLRLLYAHFRSAKRSRVPPVLVLDLIAAEDHRFYTHHGVDWRAVVRATWRNVALGMLEGASTIEQQLVRRVTGRYERRLSRKVREMLLACLVERLVPKAEIPALYLRVAYFGAGMNGVFQASRRLGFDLDKITQYQAAALVARLKYPEPSRPSPKRARQIARRADHILIRVAEVFGPSYLAGSKESENATVLDSGLLPSAR
jgi:penicillin-binding protein 1A